MIVGLGVDIAEIPRIQAAIERHGQPFLRRVFTPNEIAYCERFKNKFERYAGRFAATGAPGSHGNSAIRAALTTSAARP